jgi:hypothetical protein
MAAIKVCNKGVDPLDRLLRAAPVETLNSGLTVKDAAQRYRVGPDKIRAWIACGLLPAVNTAAPSSSKPRWVMMPEDLAQFEARRRKGAATKQAPRHRRKRNTREIDFLPD